MLVPAVTAAPVFLFANAQARLSHEPGGLLCLQWQPGLRNLATVQATFEQLQQAQRRSGATRLLLDERLAGPFSEEAKSWLTEEWLPRLAGQGRFQHIAAVLAQDVFARLSAVLILAQVQRLHLGQHRPFLAEADARAWLRQQQ